MRNATIALVMMGSLTLASPKPALAMSKDVKFVLKSAAYGAVGGTALGLASLPLSNDVKSVFIGTSVGLYLGTAIGIYFALNRQEGSNWNQSNAILPPEPPKMQETPYEASLRPLVRTDFTVLEF